MLQAGIKLSIFCGPELDPVTFISSCMIDEPFEEMTIY